MSLRAFLTRLIWLCLLPPLVLAAGLAAEHVAQTRDDAERTARQLARSAAMALDLELSAELGALRILALSMHGVRPQEWSTFYREAQEFRQAFDKHVLLVDAAGRTQFHTSIAFGQALPPPPQVIGRSAIELAAANGRPAVSDLFRGPLTQADMVALAAPGVHQGALTFVLASVTPAAAYGRRLQAMAPAVGSLALLDSRGRLISRVGPERPDAAVQRFSAPLSAAPWSVVIEIPRDVARNQLAQAAAAMVLAVGAAALAGLLGGGWAARRLGRDMRTLTNVPDTPAGADEAPATSPRIREVAAIRQRLLASQAAREQAERQRRQGEQAFRAHLEQASIALEVRQAQLRGIFESASDAILTIDAAQHIVMANTAAARIFRIPVDELVGSPLGRLIPEPLRAAHQDHVQRFGDTGHSSRSMGGGVALSGLRADGQAFPIEAAISRAHVDGRWLFTVILRDITARQQAEQRLHASQAELQASHRDLRRLLAAQDGVQENERRRIARELHDDLQQTLAAVLMEVAAARGSAPGKGTEALNRIEQLTTGAIVSTRRIVDDLRPQMLEDLGLVPALENLAAQFARRTGLCCQVDSSALATADQDRLTQVATCLYRVAQESLNNVAKHAQAHGVRIVLRPRDGDLIRLSVSDDGRGMPAGDDRQGSGHGLLGISERVRAVGGQFRVVSRAGGGTTIDVDVPMDPRDDKTSIA